MAKLVITFTPPSPVPTNGYIVKYRSGGSGAYTTVSPNPTSSPVTIDGLPNGLEWDGTVEADCDGMDSTPVVFTAEDTKTYVNCGDVLSNSTDDEALHIYPSYYLDVSGEGSTTVNIAWDVFDRPNKFDVYDEDNNLIATTGWKGTASYSGPWGATLATGSSGVLSFARDLDVMTYVIKITAGGEDPMSPLSDSFQVSISCTS